MQRSAATPTQTAAPFFSSLFGGGGGTTNNSSKTQNPPLSPTSKSHRPTSAGEDIAGVSPRQQKALFKDRKPSFGRKPSAIFSSSPGKKNARRNDSAASITGPPPTDGDGITGTSLAHRPSATQLFSDHTAPPLLGPPLDTSDGLSKMLSRGAVTPITGYPVGMSGAGSMLSGSGQQSELALVHQNIQETASKRISTLEYLRKA